ncbi:MAG: sugar kinase [Oscillospiraceae bacterium]|nr:sugar kinase [Candidatus Equicaccousia limihippi]
MRVVTFGEIMLRLSPNGYNRFFQNDQMNATFGGAEANVAVSLANFGLQSRYVTKLPENIVGNAAENSLKQFGVDTSYILRGGERLGIYFYEKGASQRACSCTYDRAHSSFQTAYKNEFDWDAIFDGADWFHFCGITPALSDEMVEICIEACKAAKQKNIKISMDTNYRQKLWTLEKARPVFAKLCEYVDLLITNPGDAKDLFGVLSDEPDFELSKPIQKGSTSIAKKLKDMFGFEKVALTLRTNKSASENDWTAMIYNGCDYNFASEYNLQIVDRVGGGDSFAAGLIYALLSNKSDKDAIEFATAASSLKHSVEGDFNRVSVAEVESLASGKNCGRVQR